MIVVYKRNKNCKDLLISGHNRWDHYIVLLWHHIVLVVWPRNLGVVIIDKRRNEKYFRHTLMCSIGVATNETVNPAPMELKV